MNTKPINIEYGSKTRSRPSGLAYIYLYFFGFLPKNLLSYLTGVLVRLKFPKILQRYINLLFTEAFGINMAEASKPLEAYASIEEVFTRELQPNKRTISGRYVASADGRLEVSRALGPGEEAIQAKGLNYSISSLILGEGAAGRGEPVRGNPSWYTTLYLAPHNYHRVHAPFAGRILKVRYIPGQLWPVNPPAVRYVPRLFVRNERLVFDFELEGGGLGWLVMVGALNVGRMATRLCPDFVTNGLSRQGAFGGGARELSQVQQSAVQAGDELGVFMLGSTTVVILDNLAVSRFKPREIADPRPIMMGESLSV